MIAPVAGFARSPFESLSGWLFDQIGPRGMFLVLAGCCWVAFAQFILGRRMLKPAGRLPSETLESRL